MTFDPSRVTYDRLLAYFWLNHDATSLCLPQYASTIFCEDMLQYAMALKTRDEEDCKTIKPILTEIVPMEEFQQAEECVYVETSHV